MTMESLNMKTLANSLPNSANTDKQLMDNFKAAALSITTLYRSSLDASKQAYSSGYSTCLQDTLQFIQAGVSVSGNSGEEMTIGRVMDWLEARLEAIKSTQEEEEEDRMKEAAGRNTQEDPSKEDRDKRLRKNTSIPAPQPKLRRRSKDNLQDMPLESNPINIPSARTTSPTIPSPSPPPPSHRQMKNNKRVPKELGSALASSDVEQTVPLSVTSAAESSPFTFFPDVVLPFPAVGTKRRHTTMVSDSTDQPTNPPTSSPSTSPGHGYPSNRRRRGRGAFPTQNATNGNTVIQTSVATEAMDVEEDGRERKRVARR